MIELPINPTLGPSIQDYLVAHNKSWDDLEADTGITRDRVLCMGLNPALLPTLPQLDALAAFMDVPLYRLIEAAGFDLELPPAHPPAIVRR